MLNFIKAIPNDQVVAASFYEATRGLEEAHDDQRFAFLLTLSSNFRFSDFEDEPPDEFADPIMGTLMSNPVRLPTSGQIVDRATIARQVRD